jgi:hypothetical protein
MKPLLTAAAGTLCLLTAAAADEGAYELRLDQKNGERTIAVSNAATGAFVVAAGGKSLDLLSSKEAEAAINRLKNGPDLDIELGDDKDDRKIIIHKMDYDDGDETDKDDKREVRILKRHQRDDASADEDRDGAGEDESDSLFSMELDGDDDASDGEDGVKERRILFIKGAGEKTAAKFIDRIDGLEADEKAAMKEAVGL